MRPILARRSCLAGLLPWLLATSPAWRCRPMPGERVAVTGPGVTVTAPNQATRLFATFWLHANGSPGPGVPMAALGLAGLGQGPDLVALVAGEPLSRILLVEAFGGRGADGAHLATSLVVSPDGHGLTLLRDAALPHLAGRAWQRETWTDALQLGATGLVDAPVRPPLLGTWQARLAQRRMRVMARLATPTRDLSAPLWRLASVWPWDAEP